MRRLLLLLLLVGLSWPLVSQTDQLTQLSSNISVKLWSLKNEIASLQSDLIATTAQLETASQNLSLSAKEQDEQKQQLMKSYDSLSSINEKLNDSYVELDHLHRQLKTAMKWIGLLGTIILIRIAGALVALALYLKRIKVPRIVDIVL